MKEQKRPKGRAGLAGTLSALLLVAMSTQASDREVRGKVVEIVDGDTLMLLTSDNWLIQVQLANIETPQSPTTYSTRSRQALSDLTLDKKATLRVHGRDPLGRSVADVFVDQHNVNLEMVRQGAAWETQQQRESALVRVEARGCYAPESRDGGGFTRIEHRF